jgi:hypothetical protein
MEKGLYPYLFKTKSPLNIQLRGLFTHCGRARNRTWIESFGNSNTIRCTTRPGIASANVGNAGVV